MNCVLESSKPKRRATSPPLTGLQQNKRPKLLKIQIPPPVATDPEDYSGHSFSSLFSESISETDSFFDDINSNSIPVKNVTLARRTAPPISGLFFDPAILLPRELAESVMSFCMETYFNSPPCNQVMLFGRFAPHSTPSLNSTSGLPDILLDLLNHLSSSLKVALPADTYELLFPLQPTMARQAIINLYQPGEGITSHVDLLGRYADGIIGVSFGSGCAMRFDKVQAPDVGQDSDTRQDVYLPEGSVIVLTNEARYAWAHGIEERKRDPVLDLSPVIDHPGAPAHDHDHVAWNWIDRGVRLSVTYRWLLPGADVVGGIHDTS